MDPAHRAARARRDDCVSRLADWVRRARATTPGRFRLWSLVLSALLVALAVLGSLVASNVSSATRRIRDNTGPALVATQLVTASLAEADAAATAAFLSGSEEDPEQRRLYEQALARAFQYTEEVSAGIGDDPSSHRSLQELSVLMSRYAGLVEAGRASNRAGVAGASTYLLASVDLLATEITTKAAGLIEASEARLERDEAERTVGVAVVLVAGGLVLIVLVAAQLVLFRRTHRILNPGLAFATVLVLVAVAWTSTTTARSEARFDRGRQDGYESIALTAQVASTAYKARADETVALIGSDRSRQTLADQAASLLMAMPVTPATLAAVRAGDDPGGAGLFPQVARGADTARERAAVAELLARWQRYRDTVALLRAAPSPEQARTVAVGPASSTFNGFNFTLESVLGDNREQFLDALDGSARALRGLTIITLALPLLAALGVLVGYQMRINEYR